jgi:hypothetical protein
VARKKAYTGEKAKAAERRLKSLELRKAGLSYEQIGKALGVSGKQAYDDVQTALQLLIDEHAETIIHMRQLELERLDALITSLWTRARGGKQVDPDTGQTVIVPPDYAALDRVLRIMERRAKLLGIDKQPDTDQQQQKVTVEVVYKGADDGS